MLLDERPQSAAAFRSYLHEHDARLRELRAFVPEVYVAVSLDTEQQRGRVRGADRIRRHVEGLFGVAGARSIAAAEIEALIVAEERTFQRVEA